jgi:hypothetical protein
MITPEQILKGKELSRIAGEVLCVKARHKNNTFKHPFYYCDVCGEQQGSREAKGGCTGFALISLTWPEAMKWRDWGVKEFGAREYGLMFVEVWIKTSHNESGPEFISLAQPEHYIKAACLCKLERKQK